MRNSIVPALFALGLLLSSATGADAWFDSQPKTADGAVSADMDTLLGEAYRQVPLPGITNFFERRMVRMLYELRDDPEYRTYSYIVTMTGEFVKICDSIGFGINASIQFSNPQRITSTRGMTGSAGPDAVLTPQAEPNGLFMPEGLAATYVMCFNEETQDVVPVYVEPEVVVSPFPLDR